MCDHFAPGPGRPVICEGRSVGSIGRNFRLHFNVCITHDQDTTGAIAELCRTKVIIEGLSRSIDAMLTSNIAITMHCTRSSTIIASG